MLKQMKEISEDHGTTATNYSISGRFVTIHTDSNVDGHSVDFRFRVHKSGLSFSLTRISHV